MKREIRVLQMPSQPEKCRGRAARKAIAAFITLLFPTEIGLAADMPAEILPRPAHMTVDSRAIILPQLLQLEVQGVRSALIRRAVERFRSQLTRMSGQEMTFSKVRNGSLPIEIRFVHDPRYLTLDMHEGYSLDVDDKGVRLTAQGEAGVLHGLSSLLQLVHRESGHALLAAVHVNDEPRLHWRGLMLDVSRHFFQVTTLERQIDAMAFVKLNVLHLHLSDGEAFRVESRRYPRLQLIGGHGEYYTQDQIRHLVAYAADRGIRIVPEFDTPGHVFSLLEAYPAYAAVPSLNRDDRATINRAALDPSNPQTYLFVTNLYREMAGLFPDRYFHIGGDEVRGAQWTTTPRIARYMAERHIASVEAMQAAYTSRIVNAVTRMGKTAIGWDEVLRADIPRNTVIQVWRGREHIADAAAGGHAVVLSSGFYLDHLMPSDAYYRLPLPDAPTVSPGHDDDTVAPPLSSTVPVIGAEAALWTEIVSDEMLDGRLWPRMGAIAERFWTPDAACDSATLYPRLTTLYERIELLGLQARANADAMLARLAPGQADAARILLEVTSPVRNYGHNHEFMQIRHKKPAIRQTLDSLADIAQPDSFRAEAFNAEAEAFSRGDKAVKPDLIRWLILWANDVEPFEREAAQYPGLRDGIGTVRDLSNMAKVGLAALDVEQDTNWRQRAKAVIADADADYAASVDTSIVTNSVQPPADLLQRILPGIKTLVEKSNRSAER
ncbi:beta-N-acetylhexosaminidase [Brytella acorum]